MLGIALLLGSLAAPGPAGGAQPPGTVQRVGIIHHGGLYQVLIDGLRQGLRELGLEEGKHVVLDIRDTKGDLTAVGEAARDFERRKVDLLYTAATSVTTAARRATTHTPIVFYAAADPVRTGLVQSLAQPGGRLTGVHGLGEESTAKRLEILKEIVPRLGRVVTFYNPANPSGTGDRPARPGGRADAGRAAHRATRGLARGAPPGPAGAQAA